VLVQLDLTSILSGRISGDGLSMDILEILVKAALTADEKKKFFQYEGSLTDLAQADRFFHTILHVPNTFSRLNAMLYRAQYKEEIQHLEAAIDILEVSLLSL
jgi:hypothetical protein